MSASVAGVWGVVAGRPSSGVGGGGAGVVVGEDPAEQLVSGIMQAVALGGRGWLGWRL